MRKIVVEPYNPKWKEEFDKAKSFYEKLLKDINVEIEHVGSTSVEGLWAKPILDIDIIVRDEEDSKETIKLLESIGYNHIGNLGVEGREALRYNPDNPNINWMEHHLYVCMNGSENLINHLLLREHLRKNKESVKLYGELKQELADKYPNDIDSYIDGKTKLITTILESEGMKLEELERIEKINSK
ncbi:GrpB family protein [Clostridium sp. D2Q-11]|uniref:GrpB family protein n=1 Tax=Anaeromonas frigoriresistens TaxID=2683708 RepID=A0A942UYW9_9FIRM|nr:GrpB family protein [Anaeromonas frigoriresistens]MBS4538861.1 GrpB family protein [Anaeromonas frigoriresistens]